MPNTRGRTDKRRANATTPDSAAASRAKAPPASAGQARKAGGAQAQSISKAAAPAAAKTAKIPAPAEKLRSSSSRAKPDALDQWVHTLPSAPPGGGGESPPPVRAAADAQGKKAKAAKPPADKATPAASPRKSLAPPTAAKAAARAARRGEPPAPPPASIAPAPASVVAAPSPPPPARVGEPVPAAGPPAPAQASAPPPTRAASAEPAPAPKTAPAAPTSSPDSAARGAFGFGAQYPLPNVEALGRNIASAIEHAGKAIAAYLRPREAGEIKTTIADDVGEMVRSLGHVAEYYMSDPARAIEAQTALTTRFIDLWAATLQRFQGAPVKSVAEPDGSDKRFSDAEWRDNPFFDFLKQAYVLTTRWADD